MRPYVLVFLFIGIGLIGCSQPQDQDQQLLLINEVVKTVNQNQINPRPLDDQLSNDMFFKYLEIIDPNKIFFTQKDIQQLTSFKTKIDDQLLNGELTFYHKTQQLLQAGIENAEAFLRITFDGKLDLNKEENLETDPKKRAFPKDEEAMADLWKRRIKLKILEEYFIEQKLHPNFTSDQLMKIAKERAQQLLTSQIKKTQRIDKETRFGEYVNAFLKVHDFQSTFMLPKEKEVWQTEIDRSLIGIGVRIKIENDYPVVEEIIVGGPAWKSKFFAEGDVILEVGQGAEIKKAVVGMSMLEVISLLKGKKDSEVRLALRKSGGYIKEVSLIRKPIELEQTTGYVLQYNNQEKVGYLRLPRFYGGEEGCAQHVLNYLKAFKEAQVNGVVFDLRNNKGGRANEARNIISYFLEDGVLMQMQKGDEEPRIFESQHSKAVYDGHLVVLVNSNSGSASELFSGTMQDYQRGLIIGSEATFGKGSIQRFYKIHNQEEGKLLGEIKLTIGRFFTASGRSPQYNGISSDLVLPDKNTGLITGERQYKYAMAAKNLSIKEVTQKVRKVKNESEIIASSVKRINLGESIFNLELEKSILAQRALKETKISLNQEAFFKRKERIASSLRRTGRYIFDQKDLKVDDVVIPNGEAEKVRAIRNKRDIQQDPYIFESYQIMQDMFQIG